MENIRFRQFAKYIKSLDPSDPRILYIWQTVFSYIFHTSDIVLWQRPLSTNMYILSLSTRFLILNLKLFIYLYSLLSHLFKYKICCCNISTCGSAVRIFEIGLVISVDIYCMVLDVTMHYNVGGKRGRGNCAPHSSVRISLNHCSPLTHFHK